MPISVVAVAMATTNLKYQCFQTSHFFFAWSLCCDCGVVVLVTIQDEDLQYINSFVVWSRAVSRK